MFFFQKYLLVCAVLASQVALGYDQCKDLCKNVWLPNKISDKYQSIRVLCHRGCRFFNIIKYEFKTFSVKKTREKCKNACQSAYKLTEESNVCQKGCELMSRKRMRDLSIIIEYPEEENTHNDPLSEPNIELLESNILSNPFVKQELEEDNYVTDEYKIPEKHIKTMPIVVPEPDEFIKLKDSEDWLTCASKNSGIPKWILFAVMMTTILVAICLSLSMESTSPEDSILADQIIIDISRNRNLLDKNSYLTDQEKQFLLYYLNENESVGLTNRTPPPKYCELESGDL